MNLFDKQLELESEMFGAGITRFYKNNERTAEKEQSGTGWYRQLIRQYIEQMADVLKAQLAWYTKRPGRKSIATVLLNRIDPKKATYITLKMVFDYCGKELMVQNFCVALGKRVEDEIRFSKLEKTAKGYIAKVKESMNRKNSVSYEHRSGVLEGVERKLLNNAKKEIYQIEPWESWKPDEQLKVGSMLLDIFISHIKYRGEPLVQVVSIHRGVRDTPLMLRPSKHIEEWIKKYSDKMEHIAPLYGPCVVQPADWTDAKTGGYHSAELSELINLVKIDDSKHLDRLTKEQMPEVFDGVNYLQEAKWMINKKTLAVAEYVMDKNLELAMPSRDIAKIRPVPIPDEYRMLSGDMLKAIMTSEQWDDFLDWKREATSVYDMETERVSKLLDTTRTIQQANKYRDLPMYFVHTLDFRGREYPQGSLVSIQGSDFQKSLLLAGDGEPLGEDGFYWLAAAGAGLYYGSKLPKEDVNAGEKMSFDELFEYGCGLKATVLQVAENPIDNKQWVSADKPWQFLAWCFEFNRLLGSTLPAEEFICHLPVFHDATCSGIQHYSAIRRDPVAGEAVNLLPGDRPRDIYGIVSSIVALKVQRMKDGKSVNSMAFAELCTKYKLQEYKMQLLAEDWLQVGINRDITKKPVMTLPYGSTMITCRKSIDKYLDKLQEDAIREAKATDSPVLQAHPFSRQPNALHSRSEAEKFMTTTIWDSIGDVVKSAREAMKYIQQIVKVCTSNNAHFEFPLPTGFILKQAIYGTLERRVNTQLLGRTTFTLQSVGKDIDKSKMRTSGPPNFIHGHDGSHLMKVGCAMKADGIKFFAAVHDSLGCLPNNVTKMRGHIKEEFVTMYVDYDALLALKEYTQERFPDAEIPEPPPLLGLDLNVCRLSEYIFGP